jgi:response regulator of citrate/malate metabolism
MRHWLFGIVLIPCLATAEIYRWTDASGQVHFTETPKAGAVQIQVKPPAVQQDAAAAERIQRTERLFEARRQEQQQAADQAQEQQAKVASECQNLRQQLAQIDHGGIFYTTDAQGQRVYYSDKQVDSARSRLKELLAQQCN